VQRLFTWCSGWDNQRPVRVPSKASLMESLPEQLVAAFLSEYRASGVYLRDRIARLAELAICEDTQTAESATRALFTALVERLADSFEPEAVTLYNRAFAQVIQACRLDPRSDLLHDELERLGLSGEEDLIARAEKLRDVSRLTEPGDRAGNVQRVIVLSRVTLGADVAITSVIIERMKLSFPAAEIVLVGGTKAPELFGGDPRVRFKEIGYRRAATIIERLLTWIDLLRCGRELTDGLTRGEYLIVDPDSRLTQLGLLPIECARSPRLGPTPRELDATTLTEGHEYLFFPSREYGSSTSQSLSELTSSWLDEVFGDSAPTYPRVSLRSDDIEAARALLNRMKRGPQPIIAINFGVGENQFKRVGGDFEASLVARLIQEGAAIVLDKGAGEDEIRRADAVIAEATRIECEGRRVRAVEINEQSVMGAPSSEQLDAEVLVWSGRIGMLAGLIGASDLYIGYDSAGQHIAAALGMKCIDVFAGFSSPRMLERWRPTGRAETRIVAVDTLSSGGRTNNDVVSEVLRHADEMLRMSISL
jgi:ADP-heptose:LPS heptosyltransferase